MRRLLRPIWFLGVAALAGFIAIGAASIASAQTTQKSQPQVDDLRVTVAGQTVSVDPKTGRLRQLTLEEARNLAEALRSQFGRDQSRPPAVITEANGTMTAEVPEDYMEVAVLKLNPDGTMSVDCVRGMSAATQAVENLAPATGDQDAVAPALIAAKPVIKAAAKSKRTAASKPARKAIKKAATVPAGKE
jgi:hypothetical protein